MTKCQYDKMSIRRNVKTIKCQYDTMSRYQNAKTQNVITRKIPKCPKINNVKKLPKMSKYQVPKNSKCLALERQPPFLVTQNTLKHHRINSACKNNLATQNIRL